MWKNKQNEMLVVESRLQGYGCPLYIFSVCLKFFIIQFQVLRKKSKTWNPLLALMHMASKDPCGLSLPTFSASSHSTQHLCFHTVATRTSFYFLKPTMHQLGPQDLCIFCLLQQAFLPFSSQIMSQTSAQAAFLWVLSLTISYYHQFHGFSSWRNNSFPSQHLMLNYQCNFSVHAPTP